MIFIIVAMSGVLCGVCIGFVTGHRMGRQQGRDEEAAWKAYLGCKG